MSPSLADPSAEFIKKIESDIRRSGFPLELHVLNVCSTKNTGRMPSIRYDHLGEVREIDLLTFFETIDTSVRGNAILQHTGTDLIIECKKSHEKPWVFFSSPPFVAKDATPFLKYISDFDLYFSSKNLPSLLAQIFPSIKGCLYADAAIPKCISYYEAFRAPTPAGEIYKAIDSVIAYLTHLRQSHAKRREKFGNFSEFFLPVIVLDGLLFEASVNRDEIEVRPRPHLQLRTYHREDIYTIDVVTRGHFEQFFNEVEHFHKQLVSAIRSIRFPSEFKTAVKAKLKEGWESPDPWVRDMLLMSIDSEQAPRKARQKTKTPPDNRE